MSIQDGSVVWQKDFLMGLRKLPLVVGYNHKETYTTSGSFTAPITGLYKITLQGAGGGGGQCGATGNHTLKGAGGGGGQGGYGVFYETLTAGTSYSYTIGAGGAGGDNSKGNGYPGGETSITINSNNYTATGGRGGFAGWSTVSPGFGGPSGIFKINDNTISYGLPGGNVANIPTTKINAVGGIGGGEGSKVNDVGVLGAGGSGGNSVSGTVTYTEHIDGYAGGDGYITFEWFDPSDAFPSIFANL